VRQQLKSQKAVLLLDNAPSHPNEDILKSKDGNIADPADGPRCN
jgi:hypothetical protein